MIKKIGLSCLSLASIIANHAFALTPDVFRAGPAVEYVLPINEPQVIANQFIWPIKAVCTMSSDNDNNLFSFKVLRKSGSFNGTPLTAGDTVNIVIHNHDKVNIFAVSGAQVELVNRGEKTMYASCSVI